MMGLDRDRLPDRSEAELEETFREVEEVCDLDGLRVDGELPRMQWCGLGPGGVPAVAEDAGEDGGPPPEKFRAHPIPPEGVQSLLTLELQQVVIAKIWPLFSDFSNFCFISRPSLTSPVATTATAACAT